jgi:hypothetical protein
MINDYEDMAVSSHFDLSVHTKHSWNISKMNHTRCLKSMALPTCQYMGCMTYRSAVLSILDDIKGF